MTLKKSNYLKPFVFVYRFLVKYPIIFLKYSAIGFFMTFYSIINIIVTIFGNFLKYLILGLVFISYVWFSFIKYIWYGFICISHLLYKFLKFEFIGLYTIIYIVGTFIKYVLYGFLAPVIYGYILFKKMLAYSIGKREKRQAEIERREIARQRNKRIEEENKQKLLLIKQKEKEELEAKKLLDQEARKKTKKEIYINENMVLEKRKFSDVLNDIFEFVGQIPKKIKNKFSNNIFVKDMKNKVDINREALLLDFEGADAEKSAQKVMYKYVAKDEEGKVITGYFPAYSKVEVHSFLLSENYEVYSIETNRWIQIIYGTGSTAGKTKIKTKDLIFFTTQLSTYVKAGIPLVEALKILSRQIKNSKYSRIFRSMIYDLTMGDNFSDAMEKQGATFPNLLINMVKASEMTGELPEALDDMSEYFTETDKTHKQMVTAMVYPSIIFVVAIAAVVFIMVWVVPQFVNIYNDIDGAKIPGITVFVMNLSHFLQTNYIWLILGVAIFLIIFIYLYKNVKAFKAFIQWLLMHTPVVKNVIIYNEVTMFTKTFASLLAHNVFITSSMEILNKITSNEIYRMLILDTINNLAKGEKISLAFKNHWAFPIPAYEMITTGERTGQLPEMMSKVSVYYQEMHRNSVTRIKTFVEPILIVFLTVVVGGIVLSIVIPMFNVYSITGL